MNGRAALTLTLAMMACIALLFLLRVFSTFSPSMRQESFIDSSEVRGITITHHGLPYTLNYGQQWQCEQYLNRALPVAMDPPKIAPFDVEAITIHLFDRPDLLLHVVGQLNRNLIFSVPTWSRDQLLMDVSDGDLRRLLSSAHDP